MKHLSYITLLCVTLMYGSVSSLWAQKIYNNNFYAFNLYSYNTAYANAEEALRISVQFAGQNNGLSSSPRTTSLFLQKGIQKNAGVGMRFLSDERGIFQSSRLMIEGAYTLEIDPIDNHFLHIGLSGGVYWESLDLAQIERNGYADLNDPMLYADMSERSDIQFGGGIVYQKGGLEVGVSTPFLVGLYNRELSENNFWQYFAYSLHYNFALSEQWQLRPMIIGQRYFQDLNLMDLILFSDWQSKYKLQLGYRTNQAILFGAGFAIGPVNIGYSSEVPFGDYGRLAGSSHSILVSFAATNSQLKGQSKKRKPSYHPGRHSQDETEDTTSTQTEEANDTP